MGTLVLGVVTANLSGAAGLGHFSHPAQAGRAVYPRRPAPPTPGAAPFPHRPSGG